MVTRVFLMCKKDIHEGKVRCFGMKLNVLSRTAMRMSSMEKYYVLGRIEINFQIKFLRFSDECDLKGKHVLVQKFL